jgi:hypothetical protein
VKYPPSNQMIAIVRANEENQKQRDLENAARVEWMEAIREQNRILDEIRRLLAERDGRTG